MINFLLGIVVGTLLMSIIIGAIYCLSDDDDFGYKLIIVLRIESILIMITALFYCVNYFIL